MNKLYKKLAVSVSSAALLMNVFAGVAMASVSCTISGNGSDTGNTCDFASLRSVSVDQSNDMDVDNEVDVHANTGENEAEDNTGGNVEIETGDVSTDVALTTSGNTNAASVEGSNTAADFELEVSGNGSDSDNKVEVDVIDEVELDQDNDADVDNDVDVHASTGENEAEDNTGGDVSIKTGDVDVNSGVQITTSVNANSAVVGNSGVAGDIGVKIMNNGSDTDNEIDLALLSEVVLEQDNDADVDNEVEVKAETGDNEAEDNTGGEVDVETGDITVDITVDTMANFNSAEVAENFLGDVELKIAGNGTESDNDVELDLIDELELDQDNDLDVDNDELEVKADTGDNEVEDSTVGGDDPAITTGGVDASVEVSTSGNANVFGDDVEFEFDFDLSELMSLLNALGNLLDL